MKTKHYFFLLVAALPLIMAQTTPNDFVVIAWNDLGMHCSNKDFSTFVVLPPYNNFMAQVIKKGDATHLPQIVSENLKVTYEIPGNTYSVGKTNFWDFEEKLFGVTLADNIGLTGRGLTGNMDNKTSYFFADGIPLTPYQDIDLTKENPYQLALVKLYDANNNLLATTQNVMPVSNEINCVSSGCHSSEQNVLNSHENVGFTKPVLCAKCHSSNALGTAGTPGLGSLSYVIHNSHANKVNNDCYKCHPGPNTQCLRDAMLANGKTCTDCHGSVKNVATTISQGRKPWLQEPSCGNTSCHGASHSEESGKLYRQSKGHGGLYCSACHGSPHAIVPTRDGSNDNAQNIALQGYKGVLKSCEVCHTVVPTDPGPHNFLPSSVKVLDSDKSSYPFELKPNTPNPFNSATTIPFSISKDGNVNLEIYDLSGNKVLTLVNQYLLAAEYSVNLDSKHLASGTYMCLIQLNGQKKTRMIVVNK
jgi:hypothetical protein